MNVPRTVSFISASFLAVGGALWIRIGATLAMRPAGVPGLSYRASGDLVPWLALGLVLVVLGMGGLFALQSRRLPRYGTWAFAGLVLASALYLYGHLQRLSLAGGWEPAAPAGFVLSILSLLLFGRATYVAGVFPRWVGRVILFSGATLFFFNDQYLTAWMAVPFGAAALVMAAVLFNTAVRLDGAAQSAARF